mgnify:CR=1 FL=1
MSHDLDTAQPGADTGRAVEGGLSESGDDGKAQPDDRRGENDPVDGDRAFVFVVKSLQFPVHEFPRVIAMAARGPQDCMKM